MSVRARVAKRRWHRADTDSGMMLTELLVASTILIILVTLVLVSVTTYVRLSTQVLSSYGNTEQVLVEATNFQKLVRSEVEPAPTLTTGANANVPAPAFSTVAGTDQAPPAYVGSSAVGPFSTTFYSNVGSIAGPARVVAKETANPVVAGKPPTWTLSVTEQLPDTGSCPFAVNSTNICTYNGSSHNPAKVVFIDPYIVNNDTPTNVYVGTTYQTHLAYTPIFTYILLQTSSAANSPGQQVPVSVVTPAPATFPWPLPQTSKDDSIFTTCTADQTAVPIANTCPGDAVQGVAIDLLIQTPGSPTPTEDNTTIFSLTSTSSLYNPLVG
jgi:hypothetical protein